jgi:hypothetical protein
MNTSIPSTSIKLRSGNHEYIMKHIIRQSQNLFGEAIDQQYIASDIQHALQYPELSRMEAVQIGMAAIKLMMGCSLNKSIMVVNNV